MNDKYIVKLRDNLTINGTNEEKNIIDNLSQDIYEERFPFEDLNIEVYKQGSFIECSKFIDDIQDQKIKEQFEIVKVVN